MAKKDFEEYIIFQGVRTHNLKNIDIKIPKNKIVTVTGVSGSGKSSLVFDTIYKEGQFRYIESLSSYLRQFFNLGSRPDLDRSSGLSPAIAIEQNKRIGNIRSTVGTLTELDDYIRLVFAKLGDIYCYKCGNKIQTKTVDQIVDEIYKSSNGRKVYILQGLNSYKNKQDFVKFMRKNKSKVEQGDGFIRYLIQFQSENSDSIIEYFYLEEPNIPQENFPIRLYGIFDRVTITKDNLSRLKEDIIKILGMVDKFGVYYLDETGNKNSNEIVWFTDKNFCANCNITYPEFTVQHFSPNRVEGACDVCHGTGETLQVDFDKIIDVYSKYLEAVLPWRDSAFGKAILEKLAEKYSIDKNLKWIDLPNWFKDVVINGDGELLRVGTGAGKFFSIYYKGIEDVLIQQYHKGVLTVDFQSMINAKPCPACLGARLKKESLSVYIEFKGLLDANGNHVKYNIFDIQNMTIDNLIGFFENYKKKADKPIQLIQRIVEPLLDRAKTIYNLGLGYLTTYRQIDTLSGGEIQRLRLAKQLGNRLSGIIYVFDEPTIGLDDGEIIKVIDAIKSLKKMGNSIIVVEHNERFIKESDWIVEIGPGAGDFGGNVVFSGSYEEFLKSDTITAKYIRQDEKVEVDFEHKPTTKLIKIKKASKHNLKNINVNIKLGSFTIVTGPSGAGKTTLMYHILYRFLEEKERYIRSYIRLQMLKKGMSWAEIVSMAVMKPQEYEHFANLALEEFYKELGVESISGFEDIKHVIYVDQTSIGKTPRSCPATFIGVFDDIRKLFAGVSDAKMLGFGEGHFSFNSSKGACPECDGYGYKHVELQFLPDTYIPCELCRGKRYKPEILSIKRRGKNISEVLDMYVQDSLEFFEDIGFIKQQLQLMVDIGLGYLKLGQPAHTLSGGESQRLKLVKNLLKQYKGHVVYFLDEPTVGLHPSDIKKLLSVLKKFLSRGDTILMIEHDKNLLRFADEVIRLEDGNIVKM